MRLHSARGRAGSSILDLLRLTNAGALIDEPQIRPEFTTEGERIEQVFLYR